MIVLDGIDGVTAHVGLPVGTSPWMEVPQALVDDFARVTGDDQWIHTDPARAARDSPYGGTVAHGYLTLSLLPALTSEIYRIDGVKLVINYGLERVRFPHPLRVGRRMRLSIDFDSLTAREGRYELRSTARFEAEDADRPVCIAQTIRMIVADE